MNTDTPILVETLEKQYSPEQAAALIDRLLAPFGRTCRISFRKSYAEITDSYLVTDKELRHLICEIITRTGLTDRSSENLAAEWQFHNVAYRAGIKPGSARDVSLDYTKDPRSAVRIATEIFDKLNIE